MSQPFKRTFPVLDEVIAKGVPILDNDPKIFDIDNVAAYWLKHEYGSLDLNQDVGPLRLPYPVMWVEHSAHAEEQQPPWDEGQDHAELPDLGWMLAEFEPHSDNRARFLEQQQIPDLVPSEYLIFAITYDTTGFYDELAIVNWVTESGEWILAAEVIGPETVLGKRTQIVSQANGADAAKTFARHIVRQLFDPVAMSIGLANCRNIKVESLKTRKERKSRRKSKQRMSGTEYKVIRLPGAPYNRIDGPASSNGQTRLHTVRGHFKTYTEEKPLYGKLTGTWWWAPSVRGKKENGEIISTYKQDVA